MTLPMRRTRSGRLHGVEPAAVLRRDPFADVQELLGRMTGLIQPAVETEAERPWMPVAEIDEDDQGYIVRLELPGISPSDIDVSIRDRELCVSGEVNEEERGERPNALRVRFGRFHHHTSMPSDVDADAIEASMNEGVLTLRIPKAQRAQSLRVPITQAGSAGGRPEGEDTARGPV